MEKPSAGVGARIRTLRQQRELPLSAVAARAGVSVATLSRVETAKQSVDVDLLLTLAKILGVPPADLLGPVDEGSLDALAHRLATLHTADRAQLMRAAAQRDRPKDLAEVVDDLLATLDLVRDELEHIVRMSRSRRKS